MNQTTESDRRNAPQPGKLTSPVYQYLEKHFSELSEGQKTHRIFWEPFAEQLATMGITGRDGTPATPATVKKTWFRVKKAMQARAEASERAVLDEAVSRARKRAAKATAIAQARAEESAFPSKAPTAPRSRAPAAYQQRPQPAQKLTLADFETARAEPPRPAGTPHEYAHPMRPDVHYRRKEQPLVELMDDPSPEDLERSDAGWPGQLPRELWGDVKIITQAWCDATEKSHRDWRLGPDRIGEPGLEHVPLKMTFEEERDWLRCWRYLYHQRQTGPNARTQTWEEQKLCGAWYSAGLETDTMEDRLAELERKGLRVPNSEQS